mgnify:FL=1
MTAYLFRIEVGSGSNGDVLFGREWMSLATSETVTGGRDESIGPTYGLDCWEIADGGIVEREAEIELWIVLIFSVKYKQKEVASF